MEKTIDYERLGTQRVLDEIAVADVRSIERLDVGGELAIDTGASQHEVIASFIHGRHSGGPRLTTQIVDRAEESDIGAKAGGCSGCGSAAQAIPTTTTS